MNLIKNIMKQPFLICAVVIILWFPTYSTFGQGTPLQSIWKNSGKVGGIFQIDHECHYPFNPESIISILLFFKDGIEYITSGEKRCAWKFSKKLETTVLNSIVLPEYFQEKFLKIIGEIKKRFS
tara:strand:+ start:3856 stop:4227 length:372 start_codon:yes stop_codon:yes gene_type:complete